MEVSASVIWCLLGYCWFRRLSVRLPDPGRRPAVLPAAARRAGPRVGRFVRPVGTAWQTYRCKRPVRHRYSGPPPGLYALFRGRPSATTCRRRRWPRRPWGFRRCPTCGAAELLVRQRVRSPGPAHVAEPGGLDERGGAGQRHTEEGVEGHRGEEQDQ